jgi:regulator of RNase E activity RraB
VADLVLERREVKVETEARKRRKRLLDILSDDAYPKRPVEIMFHLIQDEYDKLGSFEKQLKKVGYSGINPKYFDGRMIEMRSLMGIKKSDLASRNVNLVSWEKT